MKKLQFRTKYQPRIITKSMKGVKSLTDPQYKGECSIEGIIRKYGVLPQPTVQQLGADVSEYGDFATNLMRIEKAKSEFMALPSQLRERFGNDPKAFYDFVINPDNSEELVKLGLASKRENKKSTEQLLIDINETLKNNVISKEGGQA